MGEYKWEQLGYKYELSDTIEPSSAEVETAKAIFEKYKLPIY
jgi:pyruvate formate lyase activating enzyme